MNPSEIILIVVAILTFFLGIFPYALKTLRGEIQPNKITWFIWTVPLIAVASQYQNNLLTYASIPVFLAGFGPLVVFVASFMNKKSYWKLEKFDYFCLLLAIITFLLYLSSQDPFLVTLFALLTDILGAILILKKSYTHPKSESITPFISFLFLSIVSFFSMERLDFEELAFPVYFFFFDIIVIYLLREQLFSFFRKK